MNRAAFSSRVTTLLQIVLCSLFVVLVPGIATAGNCPGTSPTDYSDDTAALQWCLDNLGTVYLDPGSPGYLISDVLRFRRNSLILTSSSYGSQATIWASSGMGSIPMLRVQDVCDANCGLPSSWEISWISFDGNRANRGTSNCANLQNVRATGSYWTFSHNESQFAPCGSGLQVTGDHFQINDNLFAWNGWELSQPPAVSDGLTVDRCDNGTISGNYFYDNTDIDIAGAPGPSCRYYLNHVYHYNRFGLAGINIAANGAAGGDTFSNTIEAGYNLLTFGLILGNHPWAPGETTSDVAEVTNNTITGAVVNVAIDGIGNGYIHDNHPSGAQGNRHFESSCTYSADYTAGHYGSATIVGSPSSIVFHPDGCY
jgi:hypothetical protein